MGSSGENRKINTVAEHRSGKRKPKTGTNPLESGKKLRRSPSSLPVGWGGVWCLPPHTQCTRRPAISVYMASVASVPYQGDIARQEAGVRVWIGRRVTVLELFQLLSFY